MTISQLFLSQLADPFRIALLLGLVFTMMRTRAQTGMVIPLLAGVVFVAVIIPSTLGAQLAEPVWRQVAVGAVANIVLLAVILAVYEAIRRVRNR